MFPVNPNCIKRISFATKLFPKIKSTLGIETSKLKLKDNAEPNGTSTFDGELFCGGRSKNKDLLSFFGFIAESQRGSSTFSQLPLLRRSIKKLTHLVEMELELAGASEVLMPTLIPHHLWDKSGRFTRQQDALEHLYHFTDKAGDHLILGPTYEESVTQTVADLEPPSELDLPLLLYQTSSKFRFEPNPRFGLLRSNEFLMNDLYSFDVNFEKAKETYERVSHVYDKIFKQLGLNCLKFESSTGSIGGKYSHEYQFPVSSGEDIAIKCSSCHYMFTAEMSHTNPEDQLANHRCLKCNSNDVDIFHTLELGHTFLLSDTYSKPLDCKITLRDGSKRNLEMGCFGLGLTRILGAGLDAFSVMPTEKMGGSVQMRWPTGVEPYKLGLVVPAKRSKQYHGGSTEFAQRLVTRILDTTKNIDIIVEDRDKESIYRRIVRLQSLGVPNILVIGQKFLQDTPEVELLTLDATNKSTYHSSWLTEEQVYSLARDMDK